MTVEARENVEALLLSVKPMLLMAGVPAAQLNVATGFDFKINHYVKAFDWLHQFSMCPQLTSFKAVYELRTPAQWEQYAVLEITGLQEQVMLDEVSVPLVQRWRLKRPRMFGPSKPEVPEDDQWANDETETT